MGEWQDEGETIYVAARGEDGRVTLRLTQEPPWDSVINNVRWEGEALRFDEYMYYDGSEDFTTVSNPTGEHPYSGVKNDSTFFILQSDRNRLVYRVKTVYTPQPVEVELTKAQSGG